MIRTHTRLLQIGTVNVRRRSTHVGAVHLARACFASDKRAKQNQRRSDGKEVRKREEAGLSSVSERTDSGLRRIGNSQAVKDILRNILTRVVDLKQKIESLDELPPLWAPEKDYQKYNRDDAFQNLKSVISDFEHQIQKGVIKANGKHRHECSIMLAEMFRLLSLCGVHSDGLSPFDECRRLIDLMEKEWKIELQHNHCEYVVVCAGREQRWSEASNVFWRHIDPSHGGYNPCDISISEPVGLYAIARDAQQKNIPVVEHVFDAVLRMSMVSPSDQDRYVLAAGTAIGFVRESKAALDFLNTNSNASKFGQPLVAAVMKACILCEENDQAVRLYNELIDDNHVANEWQWSGGQDRLYPLCRDLALRALGQSSQSGRSDKALSILSTILQDEAKVTTHALYGALLACEQDGKWRDAVHIALLPFLLKERYFLVRDEELLLNATDGNAPPFDMADGSLQQLLLPVIRVCTAQGFPGAAVLSQILFATHLENCTQSGLPMDIGRRETFDIMTRLISSSINQDELLTASMVSLCGIDSFAEACLLFEETSTAFVTTGSEEVYKWARSQKNKVVSDEWQILFDRLSRIAIISLRSGSGQLDLSIEDLRLISVAAATCMRASIMMSEPGIGLILSKWIESVLPSELAGKDSLFVTDSYLAASIAIASSTENPDIADQLIRSKLHELLAKNDTKWTLSCNQTLRFLFASGKSSDALDFFQDMSINGSRNPETFEIVANGLASNKEWSRVSELYGLAISVGLNTEHLSIVAMKAVVNGPDAGNVRLLRNIVDEIANQMKKKPLEWLESKYWILKDNLGFPLLRRLMRWNDKSTARLKELAFLIAMFESRVSEGVSAEVPTLFSIVHGVIDISQEDMKTLGIPQGTEEWNDLVDRVTQEAEHTFLCRDSDFVSDVSLAFWKLGSRKKFADWVDRALSKGVQVRPGVLELARSTDEIVSGD